MVWHKLDHHNVTPFVGYTFDGDSAGILSIWQEEGNLKEYLERNPDKFLSLVSGALKWSKFTPAPLTHVWLHVVLSSCKWIGVSSQPESPNCAW